MTRLSWSDPAKRRYENGVDHGVLYPLNGPGVAWNGLVSIDEGFVGGENNSYYMDGVKYLDVRSPKTFSATLTAFSAPPEFSSCIGDLSLVPGFVLTRQRRTRFHLAYRTQVNGGESYKLHLIYNASATPSQRGYQTLGDSPSAAGFSWKIDAVPPLSESYRPSAHFTIDSKEIDSDALVNLEMVLYGTLTLPARMPSVDELIDFIKFWDPRVITPNEPAGIAGLVAGVGDLAATKDPGIYRQIPSTRLYKTATRGLYRLEK